MMLQLDGSGDMQRAAPMSAAQFGNDFILTTLLQHALYVLADGLLEILLCLLELHLGLFQLLLLLVAVRAFDAWGLYLDRFSVRGLSPGIAVLGIVLGIAVIAVLGIAVGWSVEHLAVKFALLLSYRYSFDGYGRELVCSTFRFTCSLGLSFALTIATALVCGLKGLFVARATPIVATSKSVAIYGTLHIAYAQFSHRRMTTLPHLYRL